MLHPKTLDRCGFQGYLLFMNLPKLIEIENELMLIQQDIINNDGFISEAQEAQIRILLSLEKSKVDSYCAVLDRIFNEIGYVKGKIKEAEQYVAKLENTKKNLSRIALGVVESKGGKLEGSMGHYLSIHKASHVFINDEGAIPASFLREKHVIEPDKILIKEAIKSGENVPGCEIIETKSLKWK